jgi:hypothetical protein
MAASASGEGLACWRHANAAPKLAWGLLNVGSPCLFELEAQVTGTRGCRLALLLRPPLSAVCVGLDLTCLLGIRRTYPGWVVC